MSNCCMSCIGEGEGSASMTHEQQKGQLTDYSRFLSRHAKRRRQPLIRKLYGYKMDKETIAFGGGAPSMKCCPIKSLSFSVETMDGSESLEIQVNQEELMYNLQYQSTAGYPALRQWIRELQTYVHKPKIEYSQEDSLSWEVLITNGSQQGLEKAAVMILDEEDTLLVDNPYYCGMQSIATAIGCFVVGLQGDTDGLIPSALDDLLSNWDERFPEKKFPKVLYTVPTSGNPTGVTISTSKRKEIYDIICKHNLLLIEDDPYYFLQFDLGADDHTFIESLPPSFMSMDVERRVIRLDSFSKLVSPGLRIGVVTAPKELSLLMEQHCSFDGLHVSGASQVILHSLLRHWKIEGLLRHVNNVRKLYTEKRNKMLVVLEKYFGGEQEVTWQSPSGGFFIWVHMPLPSTNILQDMVDSKVLFLPGKCFMPNVLVNQDEDIDASEHIRLSFSLYKDEKTLDVGIERLWKLYTSKRTMPKQSDKARNNDL